MSTAAVAFEHGSERGLFFEQLAAAPSRLLMLDYDGTISPFAVDRRRAFPYCSVPDLLDAIMSTCRTRVVLISGRAAREIPPLIRMSPHPEIWGSHGLERLFPTGGYECGDLSSQEMMALTEAEARLEHEGIGDHLERKPGGVAVHWRGLDPTRLDGLRTAAYRVLGPIACQRGMLLSEFDGGVELRVRRCSKDHAVRALLCEVEPDVPVAYLGDDLTDEDAFRAMRHRGLAALVGEVPRPTAAHLWLRPPQEVIQFLCDWVRACGGDM